MDVRITLSAFAAVFLAELGDKTQLAALALATGERSKVSVFVGASLALIASTALAVAGADLIARAIAPALLRRLSGGLLLVLGAWMIVTASPRVGSSGDESDTARSGP